MAKPLWLLDIDGVLNAVCTKPNWHMWPKDSWSFRRVGNRIGKDRGQPKNGWGCWVAQPVVDFITEAHEEGRAEIVWHTTWQHEANDFGKAFGLPTFDIWDAPEYKERTPSEWTWWKQPGFNRALATGRPVVWTDDHLESPMMRQFSDRSRAALFSPSGDCGLSPKNLRIIGEYLDNHKEE